MLEGIKMATERWNITDGVYTVCETGETNSFSFYRNDGRNVFVGVDIKETAIALYETLIEKRKREAKKISFKVIEEGQRVLLKEMT